MTISEYKAKRAELEYTLGVIQRKIQQVKNMLYNTSNQLSETKILNATTNVHKHEDLVVKKLELEGKLQEADGQLEMLNDMFRKSLLELNCSKLSTVIDLRVIEQKPWGYIADEIGYSSKQTRRYYKQAETKLEEKMSINVP